MVRRELDIFYEYIGILLYSIIFKIQLNYLKYVEMYFEVVILITVKDKHLQNNALSNLFFNLMSINVFH